MLSQGKEQVMISAQDVDELRKLEESLWIAQTRFDRDYMEQILSSEFIEVPSGSKRLKGGS